MNASPTLKRSDYEDYLVYLCFGAGPYDLLKCINGAYSDFSRTLHGLGKLAPEDKESLRKQAGSELMQRFSNLKGDLASTTNEAAFDEWHEATYQQLSTIYSKHGHHLYVGQAQKWINMTFKYLFTLSKLGKCRHSGFGKVYPFCHAPLDRSLIDRLNKEYNIPWPNQCTWSRLDNYNHYLCYQQQIRRRFTLVPLDMEFKLWLGKDVDTVDAT